MKLMETTFSKVPVGGFYYSQFHADWFVKTSYRMSCRGAYVRMNMYRPKSSQIVLVLVD